MDAAAQLWTQLGQPAAEGRQAVIPLARATIEAVAAAGTAAAATGPALRGDADTVAAHLAALSEHAPHLTALYRELTLATLPLAQRKGATDDALAALIRSVSV